MNLKRIIFSISLAIACSVGIISLHNTVLAYNPNSLNSIQSNQSSHITSLIADVTNTQEISINTIPVRDNIYMLMGDGGNIGLLAGEKENLIIDSQFPKMTSKIIDAINKINPKPIKYLVNTHYHFDHTDGNENMAKQGAVIIAHENTRKNMLIPHSYSVLGMEKDVSPSMALPVITFEDKLQFNLGKEQIDLFEVPPAHTNGDAIIYFPKHNVIHVGDIFFNGFYPFIDTGVGGSTAGMIEAIDLILPLCNDETLIIPGHGKLSNKSEFIKFQNMLSIVNERVKSAMSKNMTLDDLIKANLLDDLNGEWGNGLITDEQIITITYNGLKNN